MLQSKSLTLDLSPWSLHALGSHSTVVSGSQLKGCEPQPEQRRTDFVASPPREDNLQKKTTDDRKTSHPHRLGTSVRRILHFVALDFVPFAGLDATEVARRLQAREREACWSAPGGVGRMSIGRSGSAASCLGSFGRSAGAARRTPEHARRIGSDRRMWSERRHRRSCGDLSQSLLSRWVSARGCSLIVMPWSLAQPRSWRKFESQRKIP